MAMLCLVQHKKTKKKIVVGNTHLISNPFLDYINVAYAHYLVDKAAEFIRQQGEGELPFILCGDMNSQPSSSVISAFHGEDIENSNLS